MTTEELLRATYDIVLAQQREWPIFKDMLTKLGHRVSALEAKVHQCPVRGIVPPKTGAHPSESGQHFIVPSSEVPEWFQKQQLLAEADVWRGIKKSTSKVATHLVAVGLTALAAIIFRYLERR